MAKRRTAFYTARMEYIARTGEEMSQVELARRTGLTQGLISDLESGKRSNPTWDVLSKIAQILGVRPDQLLPPAKLPKFRPLPARVIADPLYTEATA